MADSVDLIDTDIEAYLDQHRHKSLLRFIACGSADDGKSTLIERLLYESKMLFDDQVEAIEADSKKGDTQGGEIDFALRVDGLAAEREPGRTIDVAYRFFSTDKRKFIVADTPGHEQYTRNMITAASTADVAIILVDARKGLLTQSRRHSYLVSLIGIRKVVLAVNKMDLMGYAEATYADLVKQYREFAAQIGLADVTAIPLSALKGDNLITASDAMPWYQGPTLLSYLETVAVEEQHKQQAAFRLPVQWVNRPHLDFRGFAGSIASGSIRPGDRVRVQPSGRESHVARIVSADGDLELAVAGQSIMLTLTDEVDISRGDLISRADSPAEVADQFEATLVWLDDAPMLPGRPYLLKLGPSMVGVTVTEPKYRINLHTMAQLAAKKLEINEIGVCNIALDRALPFDAYTANRETGGFILIDRISNNTIGAGMLNFALRRSHNIHRQHVDVDKAARASQKGQRPAVVWLTGLSGAGKSTIANLVEKRLLALGRHSYLLDGDNVRHGLNRDLGFSAEDRVENVRRVAEVAHLMVDAGLIVITAFISPFKAERALARSLLGSGEFIEVYVDTSLQAAESRDVKGLYQKARRGELSNFTGISSPYEAPENPDLRVNTERCTPDQAAQQVIDKLLALGLID